MKSFMFFTAPLAAGCVLVLGCATGYHEKGFLGYGYSETRLDTNTARVSFRGDENTPLRQVERSALYRAAEYTLAEGFESFVITDTWSRTEGGYTNPGPVDDISYQRSHDTVRQFPYEMYRISYVIDMYRAGDALPENVEVFNADAVLNQWEPVRRDSPQENFRELEEAEAVEAQP